LLFTQVYTAARKKLRSTESKAHKALPDDVKIAFPTSSVMVAPPPETVRLSQDSRQSARSTGKPPPPRRHS
jgi:hypothetical protein